MFRSFIIASLSLLLLSCSSQQTPSAGVNPGVTEQINKEAEKVATEIAGLLYSKCNTGYFWSEEGKELGGPVASNEVTVKSQEGEEIKGERFEGYQWKGMALFGGGGTVGAVPGRTRPGGFEMFKRGGKWFIKVDQGHQNYDALEVSALQSIAPACPAK